MYVISLKNKLKKNKKNIRLYSDIFRLIFKHGIMI